MASFEEMYNRAKGEANKSQQKNYEEKLGELPDNSDTYSSPRHQGVFSKENPYYSQLLLSSSAEDQDALYERAVEWEADRANLEEQRAYDSPLAQVARSRMAGINPDISSGSGGSSISSGSGAQIADQQGQTKFKNKYDDTNLVLNALGTTANFVSGLVGSVSGILSSVSQFRMVPSQIALNESQSALNHAQANELNQLLDGKKKSLKMSNFNAFVELAAKMQGLLKMGFTDEEGTSMLKAMGVDDAEIAPYMSTIRQIHERPELVSDYVKAEMDASQAQSRQKIYDKRTVDEMENLRFKVEEVQLQLQYASAALQESIQYNLLNNDEYIGNIVAAETIGMEASVIGAKDAKARSQLSLQQAHHDAQQWAKQIDDLVAETRRAETTLNKMFEKGNMDGKWTDEELFSYNTAYSTYLSLKNIGASEIGNMRAYMMKIYKTKYDMFTQLGNDGKVLNIDFIAGLENFGNNIYNDIYTGKKSTGEIVRDWINTTAGAARDLSLGVGGVAKGSEFVGNLLPRPKMGFNPSK